MLQPGIAWLTFYRSDIRVVVILRCRLCTMISRDPHSKSNVGRDHYCQIRPAGVTLLWGDEFFLGILKSGWSSQCGYLLSHTSTLISLLLEVSQAGPDCTGVEFWS